MREHRLQDAVQLLRERMGARWEGAADEGRNQIEALLAEAFHLRSGEARELFEALKASGQVRYIPTSLVGEAGVAGQMAEAGIGTSGTLGTPLGSGEHMGAGHWEIGGFQEY